MLPAALHPTSITLALGATHGLVVTARGTKAPAFVGTEDVRLYVDGERFWEAVSTFAPSGLVSMAQVCSVACEPLSLLSLCLLICDV